MVSISRWRLRLVSFEVRIWRLKACPRLNLPVPVFLKRFAAPLCVLSFGIAVFLFYNIRTGFVAACVRPVGCAAMVIIMPNDAPIRAIALSQVSFIRWTLAASDEA